MVYFAFTFLQAVVLCLFVFGQVSGTAPGDETCSLQPHATNVIVLMDSFNYNTLLNSVWTTQNYDGSGVTVRLIIIYQCDVFICDHSGPLVLEVIVKQQW